MEQGGGDLSSARGYKKPVVECRDLDAELLRRLERNDRHVVGLKIEGGEFWVDGADRIIGENSRLRVLHIVLHNGDLEEDSWLADLGRGLACNRSIELLLLDINCPVELDVFHVLAPFLENNDSLRCIILEDNSNPQMLSSMVSAFIKCKHLRLECIEVDCSLETSDKAVEMFFEQLNNLHNLTDLAFSLPTGRMGCAALATLLTNPAARLTNLRPTFDNIDDECISIIGDALSKNSSLLSLEIIGNGRLLVIEDRFVSSNGLSVFFGAVSQSESLQYLSICNTVLLDCDFACLTRSLSINQSIKKLKLHWNGFPSRHNVWPKFAEWLRSPNATITKLTIRGCRIKAKDKIKILMSLKANKFITKVKFEMTGETKPGLWKGLSRLLCDKTSIDNTYMSNHTLHTFLVGDVFEDEVAPHEIASLLKMNESNHKVEVARCKVLGVHFTGEVTANHPLARFPERMLPHVLSWVGRDNLGFSAMFNAVQFAPSLFGGRNATSVPRKERRP